MRRGLIGRAAVDGVCHGLLLIGMNELLSSPWAAEWPEWPGAAFLAPALIAGVVSAVVFELLIHPLERCRQIAGLSLMSAAFFVLTLMAAMLNAVEWHFRLLPVREMGNGDGMLLVLVTGVYLLTAGVLRVLAWLLKAVRIFCDVG